MTVVLEMGILLGLLSIAFVLYGEQLRSTNTLVLGSGRTAADLLRDIESDSSSRRHNVLGFVNTQGDENLIPADQTLHLESDLLHLARELDAKAIVIAIGKKESGEWAQQLLNCKLNGISLIDATALEYHGKTVDNPLHSEGNLADLTAIR